MKHKLLIMRINTITKAFRLFFVNPKSFFLKFKSFIRYLINAYLKKDFHTLEYKRWYYDNGDQTLRLNYPSLNNSSIVFDLGGYLGDFAMEIHKKYQCKIYIFEPHPYYFKKCNERFNNNINIKVFNYGISNKNQELYLTDDQDGSSTDSNKIKKCKVILSKFKSFKSAIKDLDINKIDLMKINIEGGEFPLMEYLIENNILEIVKNYQIQFHKFVPGSINRRKKIINELNKKFKQTWCYEFVWENWTHN